MAATIVLVHGAFHGAWCFGKVLAELRRRDQAAIAIDLPGSGDDQTPIAEVSLAGNAAAIAAAIERQGEPVILLGHSLGGISVSAAAELVPEKVALLVYLAAFLPRRRDSAASIWAHQPGRQEVVPSAIPKAPDSLSFSARADRVREIYYNHCSDEDVAFAKERLRPQAYSVWQAGVEVTHERFGRVPRVYIECLDDKCVSLALQRDMVAKSPGREVISLPTDHSPFLSAPGLLADVLARLAGHDNRM